MQKLYFALREDLFVFCDTDFLIKVIFILMSYFMVPVNVLFDSLLPSLKWTEQFISKHILTKLNKINKEQGFKGYKT